MQDTAAIEAGRPRIAIVGMSCRLPGAPDAQHYWQNLRQGVCSISEVPVGRWPIEGFFSPDPQAPDRSVSKWGGFVDGVEEFDASYFGISAREAHHMDPQQRLLLQEVIKCIENAGYSPSQFAATRTGVFVGASLTDHWAFMAQTGRQVSAHWAVAMAMSLIANRVSYQLNLNGPSLCVDTACSSSLVALHYALQSLRTGECTAAIVAGCSVMSMPTHFKSFSQMGMLSPHGLCRTFDADADGYVRSEGLGVVLLKPEAQALADGDRILGIVCGSAVNHGGHARTLTAPNAFSQARVILDAHVDAGVSPDSIAYIEAHGTGTPLGDPIEVLGLKRAFARLAEQCGVALKPQACAIGSAKTNLGHLEPAAGMAGLIKVLLSFEQRELPPLLHFGKLNPRIELEGSPFYIADRLQPWPALRNAAGEPYPLRAGVSCFGFGGTNSHVVLEEGVVPSARPAGTLPAYPIIVSARSAPLLAERLQALHAHMVEVDAGDPNFMLDASFTLAVGRQQWAHRAGWVCTDAGSLRETLARCVAGDRPPGVWFGERPDGGTKSPAAAQAETSAKAVLAAARASPGTLDREGLIQLVQAYALGVDLDWSTVYDGQPFRRMALPTYPFARRRHSILLLAAEGEAAQAPAAADAAASADAAAVPPREAAAAPAMPASASLRALARLDAASDAPASVIARAQRRPIRLVRLDAAPARPVPTGATHLGQAPDAAAAPALAPASPSATPVPAPAPGARVAEAQAVPASPPARTSGVAAAADGAAEAGARQPPSQAQLVQRLRQTLASALYVGEAEVDTARPFVEQGLDSVIGVEWMRAINTEFGTNLPVTNLYDHPTIQALARHLAERLERSDENARVAGFGGAPAPAASPLPPEHVVAPGAPLPPPPADPLPAEVLAFLRSSLAKALYVEPAELRDALPFVEQGLDSVVGVEWIRAINGRFGLGLQATCLYDHPTLHALAAFVGVQLGASAFTPATPAPSVAPVPEPALASPVAAPPPPPIRPAEPVPAVASQFVVRTNRGPQHEPAGLVLDTVRTLEELAWQAWTPGAPASDEVTLQVLASAVNFPDLMCVQGLYPTMPAYPFVPGFEVSGVITAVGAQAGPWRVGDEVFAATGRRLGGHASYVNVPASHLVRKPGFMSHEQACSLPVIFSTVAHAFDVAMLRAGEHVLIQTASGGCGLAALQLARLRGAVCWGTSSRDDKLEVLRRLGVEHAINYKSTPFDEEIRRVRGGRGVDVVLNMLSGEAIQRGLNSLAPGGRYLELAVHALRTGPRLDLSSLVQNQSVHSLDMRRLALEGSLRFGDVFEPLLALFESRRLVPVVTRIFPAAEIGEALRLVGSGRHVGKVVVSHTATQQVDLLEPCVQALLEQQRAAAESLRVHARQPASLRSGATPVPARCDAEEAIAVIGMAGRFPGADGLDDFWDNLLHGRDSVTEVPPDRWPWQPHFDARERTPGKTYSRWMGAVQDVEAFDALFFNIAPAEARLMDPEQRLVLQSAWHCFEDAGIRPSAVAGTRCGVFMGCAPGDYGSLLGADHLTAQGLMGGAASILSGRIAYYFNLQGPCLSIDTACSSALVAVAQACSSLARGECEQALAGGAYVMAGPAMHIMTSQAGMLSRRGRCATFDQQADGFVPSEGVGVVLLKRLADAVRDGDRIHGVIRGWGVRQDGKTNGITAPSAASQTALEREVYDRFSINPEHITLVEAHGTGTKLGDPIEVDALNRAFRAYTQQRHYCALGSVKSNIGHGMTSAGIAGLIKVMLCLRHRQLVPTVHFSEANEHIPLADSPFFVNTERRDWTPAPGAQRMAALSSFGFSGTNAHLVLAEAPGAAAAPLPGADGGSQAPELIVLSARDESRLRDMAGALRVWLLRHDDWNLRDLAHTLQVGREPMRQRFALPVTERGELLDALHALTEGRAVASAALSGSEAEGRLAALIAGDARLQGLVGDWLRCGELDKVAQVWAQGVEPDWKAGRAGRPPARLLPLPGYPFARERLWAIEGGATAPAAVADALPRALVEVHPLLARESDRPEPGVTEVCYDGDEFFLADHRVRGQRVLSAAAQSELALAAAARLGEPGEHAVLADLHWKRPLVADPGRRPGLRIALAFGAREGAARVLQIFECVDGPRRRLAASGVVRFLPRLVPPPPADLNALRAACTLGRIDGEQCYRAFAEVGLAYGPAHRGIDHVLRGPEQALARLCLRSPSDAELPAYGLHPGLLDSALQACLGVLADGHGRLPALALPLSVSELEAFGPCERAMWAHVRRRRPAQVPGRHVFDIDLLDEEGGVRARLTGFALQETGRDAARSTADSDAAAGAVAASSAWLRTPADGELAPVRALVREWQPLRDVAPGTAVAGRGRHLVLLCECGPIDADALANALGSARCVALGSAQSGSGERYEDLAVQVLGEIRRASAQAAGDPVLVQLVHALDGEGALHGGLGGLLRAAQQENPRLQGQVLGVARSIGTAELARRLGEQAEGAPTEQRWLDGERQQVAWRTVSVPDGEPLCPWRSGGVYVVTGGAGGVGRAFARDIVASAEAVRVVLVGRSDPGAALHAQWQALSQRGCSVEYRRADITSRDQVAELVASVVARHGRLDGILHGAAVLRDGFIRDKAVHDVHAVLGPKVRGLVWLDECTADLPLDFLVAFSSMAGLLGNAGQADYAAGNAFLDAFMQQRARRVEQGLRHGRSLSLAWPLWDAGGMAVEAQTARRIRQVVGEVGDTQALRLFRVALTLDAPLVALSAVAPQALAGRLRALQPPAPARSSGEGAGADERARVEAYAAEVLARVLRVPAERWTARSRFEQFGIDSILQASVIQAFESRLGELPRTLMFEYTTFGELVDYLLAHHAARILATEGAPAMAAPEAVDVADRVQGAADGLPPPTPPLTGRQPAAAATTNLAARAQRMDIAIVGIGGRYPRAASLEELWARLLGAENCVTALPEGHWHGVAARNAARAHPWYGGFLDGLDRFDHRLFGLGREEAAALAPELRQLLEIAWQTFEDAGYSLARLRGMQERRAGIGVFVGSMYNQSAWSRDSADQARAASTESEWHLANRLSNFFDLRGPSMAINSACSSSLTAIHVACESLRQGGCSMALAGGVNLTLDASKYERLREVNFLDDSPYSRSFGQGEGYVPGEGVGTVLLKPLAEAEADGDRVLGVILSSVATHGGGRQKYTVPDPRRQAELMSRSLELAGVDASTITCVESAANGSPLGDPIEVVALRTVFEAGGPRMQPCALGSVKSNLGHLEAASGMSQLSKVLLQLRHRTLVPTLNAQPMNRAIRLEGSAFRLQAQVEPWTRLKDPASGEEVPLRAMINSFGAGGSYCNLIVEEGRPAPLAPYLPQGALPFVWSAMSEGSLRRRAAALAAHVRARPGLALDRLAASLLRANNDLPQRAVVLAADADALVRACLSVAAGPRHWVADEAAPMPSPDLEASLRQWVDQGGELPALDAVPMGVPGLEIPGYCFDHEASLRGEGSTGAAPAFEMDRALKAMFEQIAQGRLSEPEAWQRMQEAEE